MSRYRKIDVRMWSDAKFRALTPRAQLLWMRLLTGPETTNIPGVVPASRPALWDALKLSPEAFDEAFREISSKGMAKADWESQLVWIPNAFKYNPPESPNVVRSWRSTWDEVPECALKCEAFQALRSHSEGFKEGFLKAFEEALKDPYPHPCPNQEQEQEQEQDHRYVGTASPSAEEPLVLENPGKTTPKTRAKASSRVDPAVRRVWDRYLDGWSKNVGGTRKPVLSPDRTRVIVKRLAEGFAEEDLLAACDGLWLNAWNMGENPEGKRYTDVDHAIGSAKRIERNRELAEKARPLAPMSAVPLLNPEPAGEAPEGLSEALAKLSEQTKNRFETKPEVTP